MPISRTARVSRRPSIIRIVIGISYLVFALSVTARAELPVFPGAVGFGIDTIAGRGGEVLRVSNLNDSGPGSLRAAAEAAGPRTVVFDVAGTIELETSITLREPFVTLAGQTAPPPGITLKGAGLRVKTHDVLVQHLRVRPGDAVQGPDKENRDAVAMTGSSSGNLAVYNVVVDHCSFSWGTDENVSTWYDGVHSINVTNSIISEGLREAGHPKGAHSMGYLVGDHTQNAAIIGNLFVHNANRNPLVKGDVSAFIANNVVYNFGGEPMATGDLEGSGPSLMTVVGNDIIPGADSRPEYALRVASNATQGTAIYLSDNRYPGQTDDPWSIARVSTAFDVKVDSPPVRLPGVFRPLSSDAVRGAVLAYAGARPTERDAVDARIVEDVRRGTGRIIDSQDEVGGWPATPRVSRVLALPADPNGDDDGDGYTNLESLLHELAARVQGRAPAPTAKLSISDLSVSEGDGIISVDVSLDRPLDRPFSVLVYTHPGTAINGRDFYGLARHLRFDAGVVRQSVAVQILENTDTEATERFSASLHIKGVDFVQIEKRVATITIEDND